MVQYIGMKTDFNTLDGFEWDEGNLEHIKKHNVEAPECEEMFFNLPLLINEDPEHSSKTEMRFEVLGQTNERRKLFLVFTIRNKKIRIISTRDQNQKERREYEKQT